MGIRTYKEWLCATGDSATYLVAAEVGVGKVDATG
jgi:hypothetical protein